MHPILIHLGAMTLYSYGVLVALACIVATLWVMRRAQAAGEDVDAYISAIFWIIFMGFVGARLLHVIYFPQLYLNHPLRILLDRGGLVWYGGLLMALVTSCWFVFRQHLSMAKFGDILVVPAGLGLAIGRVGCFLSGCCYGKPTNVPWAVQFPVGHETYPNYVHPTQLYESFSLVILTLLLAVFYRRQPVSGLTTCLFFIGYGFIRFIIEYFRGDGVYWVPGLLTASQVISLAGIVVGGVAAFYLLQQTHQKRKFEI